MSTTAVSIARRGLGLVSGRYVTRGIPATALRFSQPSQVQGRTDGSVIPQTVSFRPGAWLTGLGGGGCSRFMSTASGGTGGGDKEDESDDDFKPQRKAVSSQPDEVSALLKKQVTDNKVMLYMKGTPSEPKCGFSAQVVRILHLEGVSFSSVNVLDYPAIREGIKQFSEWPTIPQVFVNGEFVGGCDILSQLHQSGELTTMFKEAKLED
ncbi:unnamed protein product [Choristocarpus tenellus]